MLKFSCGFFVFEFNFLFLFCSGQFYRDIRSQLENEFVKTLEAEVDAFVCLFCSNNPLLLQF